MVKVKYFIYYFDNGYYYFDYTFNDLKKTDITFRYKTNSKLYDIFIKQKKFTEIKLLEERDLDPKDIKSEGEKILKKLNLSKHKYLIM